MRVDLIAPDKIADLMTREFPGVDADRKKVLLQSVEHAFKRGVELELHENFSKNLLGAERAFYSALVTVTRDEPAAAASAAPVDLEFGPEEQAGTETAAAARAEEARARDR